jgi:phosphoketolase
MVLGRWGTTRAELHFYVHLNRVIKKYDLDITTPFDMTVLNELDRFHLVIDTIDRVPQIGDRGIYLKQQLKGKVVEHKQGIDRHGEDLPEIRNWKWGGATLRAAASCQLHTRRCTSDLCVNYLANGSSKVLDSLLEPGSS